MSLREAAQQALEALERIAYWSEELQERVIAFDKGIMHWRGCVGEANGILPTLRAALEPVTNCHEKDGDKLSTPLPILAVHVGYRYQSPVGGWEYGDHIPAGFDTQKWAHQKIYILQEQS